MGRSGNGKKRAVEAIPVKAKPAAGERWWTVSLHVKAPSDASGEAVEESVQQALDDFMPGHVEILDSWGCSAYPEQEPDSAAGAKS